MMMRISTKSGRALALVVAVVFLMTSLTSLSALAGVIVGAETTTNAQIGGSVTINVDNASGSEQTTVLVYLGTPEDGNIIYIDQTAAQDGKASFTFKVPTTASAGTYTVLAGSESTELAATGSIVVTAGSVDPEATLVSIAVSGAKIEYNVGDEFVKPTVTATYSDATTADVTADATFAGFDSTAAAVGQTITVTYDGKTTAYTVDVIAPAATLESIAVSNAKIEYNVGDEFVKPVVTATYSDATTADVTADATFAGFDSTAAAVGQIITVTYEGKTTTYTVDVTAGEDPVANPNVRNGSYAIEVTVNTAYNFRGSYRIDLEPSTDYIISGWSKGSGSVLARIRPNDSWSTNLGDLDLKGSTDWTQSVKRFTTKADTTFAIVSIVTNTYGGKGTRYIDDLFIAKASDPTVNLLSNPGFEGETGWTYANDMVRINSEIPAVNNLSIITVSDAKVAYIMGDEFVAPKVTAIYYDGTTQDVSAEATFEGFDSTAVATKTVTVKYNNAATTYAVTIAEDPTPDPTLESIAVSNAKVNYTVGDAFEAPVVTATYSNGSTQTVVATFTGYDMAKAGTQTVTATYEGKTAIYEITVVDATPTYEATVDTSKDLGYSNDEEPADVYYVREFLLSTGNGEYEVKIGDRTLYWSTQRGCYVGVVDAANYNAQEMTFANVVLTPSANVTTLKIYGDVSGDNRINTVDISNLKNYLELGTSLTIRPSADVNFDGRIDATDLLKIKGYVELEEAILTLK
ncbi:MAG: bacterial Ig-like domain-containing protein [Eubacteriales bacterium]|nr:bacterial Ig-like domain-containing protein [Eubacteriales bacterium]